MYGRIGRGTQTADENISAMAGWHTIKALDISGETGDHVVDGYFVVDKKWAGLVCREVMNTHAETEATVIFKTPAGDEVSIKVKAGERSGILPALVSIKKIGTSDDLYLFCQKMEKYKN